MGFLLDAEATRSTLLSVDTTLSENINATQNYIPVASTTNFSTSVVAEIETTNEVVSFTDISENNFQQSQTFDNGYWQKLRSTVTADATTAPDGTTTAEQLTQASGQTSNGLIQVSGAGLSVTNTKTYTISIFAKKGTNRNYLMIKETMGRGTGSSQWFNLNTGAVASVSPSVGSGLTSTISSVGDGWFRCSIKFTADATRTGQCGFIVSENDGNTSNTDDQGFIYIWGAQFEEASTASTYLPTTSSVLVGLTDVTRGVNGTTAASASSGDSIQQLPFAFQQVLATVTSTLSENIDTTQNYVPVASTSGFVTGVNATIESTNEVISFTTLTENKAKFSEQLNNGVYTKSGISIDTDVTTAPDGTSTADRIKRPASTGTKNMYQSGISVISGNDYTFSIYLKKDNNDFFQLGFFAAISSGYVNFDLVNGIFSANAGASGSMTAVGNDWYLCTMTATSGLTGNSGFQILPIDSYTDARNASFTNTTSYDTFAWGFSVQESSSFLFYLPTTANTLVGLGNVTRGVNGTTAQAASSGASISQTPSLGSLDMPVRLKGVSTSSDGTGAGRLTLCDNNGDTLCDVDIPDNRVYTLEFGGGIVFPNGIFISNTDNITSYTLYTDKFSGNGLTS